jgi:hypothetical protein
MLHAETLKPVEQSERENASLATDEILLSPDIVVSNGWRG